MSGNECGERAELQQLFCLFVYLKQKDSGDEEDMEKNSEDEDGQLEEQIERLQEKVESAQSEQKNLFLVIFQVRPGPSLGRFTNSNASLSCCTLV